MLVEVALPVPVPRTFTYEVEDGAAREGVRVRVPFSGRRLIGWIVGPGTAAREIKRIRQVDAVLDEEPSVPPELLRLCRWIATYYLAPLGVVLRAALPALLSDTARTEEPVRTRRVLRLVRELPSLAQREETFGRARRQLECFEVVEAGGGAADIAHLTDHLGFSVSVMRGLVAKGVAVIVDERLERDPFADTPAGHAPVHTLTPAQRAAVDRILAGAGNRGGANAGEEPDARGAARPFLLFGVTGSGKTLVYIEVLEEIVARQGRGAIVLVPEIALTPQTVARFRARFGDVVAVLHSGLSEGERYDAWRALRTGERRVAIGARSAIFAPVADLGAIIVDEEHEASYKQSEAPRYHAREVAVVRAAAAGAICVLGSATPAIESYNNTRLGKYTLIELPERIAGRPLPPVRIVDLRAAEKKGAHDRPILTPPLAHAIEGRLARHEQTILLLNRRGYATFVQCRDCGRVWRCTRCDVSLTFHRARRRLVCHYCFHEEATPVQCPDCHSANLSFRGVGTEQVEREVGERFPSARIARMDVDTTSAKWSHHEILGRVGRHEVDILLGTQMIAKGLDFPNVTLVGVVNADVAMNLPDFRASERTFQLLTQVAGRAGRGEHGGEVLVQTALPNHYAIRHAINHDYRAFAEDELEQRRLPLYPPYTRLVNVVISGTDEEAVMAAARAAADRVRELLRDARTRAVTLTGPAPCPIDRIRGRWRWHFLLRAKEARALGSVCRELESRDNPSPARADVRIVLDRDPVTLM